MEQTTHDMSEYSDRLWKIAYERGKAEKLQEVMDILDIMLDEDMVARIREWIDHTDNKVVAESATTTDCISRQTAIEAIEGVDWYHVNPKGELVSGSTSDEESWYKAEDVYKAIESLPPVEPKPVCEDAVSKGELMTSLQGIWDAYTPNNMTDFQDMLEDIHYKIKNAPPVTPTVSEDCISREWIKDALLKYGFTAPDMTVTELIEDAPSVAPKAKEGHYIKGENGEWYCSNCRRTDDKYSVAKFCWHCGAKMKGGTENENNT